MAHTLAVNPETLTLRHVLSVRCPMCRAKSKEQCTLTTGHPSAKTHLARQLAAAKVSCPENSGLTALRSLTTATGRGLRAIFQHK